METWPFSVRFNKGLLKKLKYMPKLRKITNIALIFTLIGTFLCSNNSVYASNISHLRLPMDMDDDREKDALEAIKSNQQDKEFSVAIVDIDNTTTAKLSKENFDIMLLDMGFIDKYGHQNPKAGLDVLEYVVANNLKMAILINSTILEDIESISLWADRSRHPTLYQMKDKINSFVGLYPKRGQRGLQLLRDVTRLSKELRTDS